MLEIPQTACCDAKHLGHFSRQPLAPWNRKLSEPWAGRDPRIPSSGGYFPRRFAAGRGRPHTAFCLLRASTERSRLRRSETAGIPSPAKNGTATLCASFAVTASFEVKLERAAESRECWSTAQGSHRTASAFVKSCSESSSTRGASTQQPWGCLGLSSTAQPGYQPPR